MNLTRRRIILKPHEACFRNYSFMASLSICLSASLSASFEPDGDITDRTARAAKGGKRRSEQRTKERGKKPGREVITDN